MCLAIIDKVYVVLGKHRTLFTQQASQWQHRTCVCIASAVIEFKRQDKLPASEAIVKHPQNSILYIFYNTFEPTSKSKMRPHD